VFCTDTSLLSPFLNEKQRLNALTKGQLFEILKQLRHNHPDLPVLNADELVKKVFPRERLANVFSTGDDQPLSMRILGLLEREQLLDITGEVGAQAQEHLTDLASQVVLSKEQCIRALSTTQKEYLQAHMPGLLGGEDCKSLTQLRSGEDFSEAVARRIHVTILSLMMEPMVHDDLPKEADRDAHVALASDPEQQHQHDNGVNPEVEVEDDESDHAAERSRETLVPVWQLMGYPNSNVIAYKLDRRTAKEALAAGPNPMELNYQHEWMSLTASEKDAQIDKIQGALPSFDREVCCRLVRQMLRVLPLRPPNQDSARKKRKLSPHNA